MSKKIALVDLDTTKYPNLALMKISSYYKKKGYDVEWCNHISGEYEQAFVAKVFTYTNTPLYHINAEVVHKGGTGFSLSKKLSEEIEHICPDYNLYNCKRSYGFLTRGCPNKCSWCFVPQKEGDIRANADISEFLKHKEVVLMDNNVLAHAHGIEQIEKMARLGIAVDFNQGIDARLIDHGIARRLAKLKWISCLRLACDTSSQMPYIQKAVRLLRWYNCNKPSKIFCYVLIKNNIDEALERIKFLKGLYVTPFAQPYRPVNNQEPSQEQKDFARWVNHKAIFNSVLWRNYKGRSF